MDDLILVRGAGDLASGVIARLVRAGFHVAALETERPMEPLPTMETEVSGSAAA